MIALNSSCIAWVEYIQLTRTLHIGFQNGRSYTLHGVPEYHYRGLLSASSAGRYFNQHLRGKYS
ncbi:MAG: KTSC domain-containing protein [Verrucomicrobiae bacterium]|nr:KTSC domain-containing protein [Verrucomicrobiae bacterium]